MRLLLHLYKSILYTMLVLSASLSLTSCAAFIAGGAGAGAYSYFSGNLVKSYRAEYYKAVRTSSKVMKQLKFKVTGKTGDALKTVLRGKRADGSPVTIVIERVDPRVTKIGVRNGVIGITNKKASEQVHQRISRQIPEYVVKKTKKATSKKKKTANYSKKKSAKTTPPKKAMANRQPPVIMAGPKATTNGVSPFGRNTVYIYYRNNDQNIPSSAYNTLNKVAAYLLKNPAVSIDIRGYTDSKGDPGYNLRISQERADAVRDYLVVKKVATKRVNAKGYGASNFLESNQSENLRAMNRRIELQFKE